MTNILSKKKKIKENLIEFLNADKINTEFYHWLIIWSEL